MPPADNWKVLSEEVVFAAEPFIQVSRQAIELPGGHVVPAYYQLAMPDAVIVYAETASGEIIVLRSYRHGARRVCLGFPGGNISPGEDTLVAAQRELLEETGYVASNWQPLGDVFANANHRGQELKFFRATGCRRVAAPNSGDLEEFQVILLTPEHVAERMWKGEFPFAGQVALFAFASATRK